MEKVLLKYGSIEAYQEHVRFQKAQYENDKAAFLKKEQDRIAMEKAKEKKSNEKNSMENQLRVARWMSNYDTKIKEIVEEEESLIEEMNKEEMLAGLCLMQDDAVGEHK